MAGLMMAIFAFPLGLLLMMGGHSREGWALLVYPFLVILFVFIGHAIFFALYNFVARYFGGVEVNFKDVEEQHLKEFKDG